VRPDVVVQHRKRELGVERDGLCAQALGPAHVDVAVFDAEEARGGRAMVLRRAWVSSRRRDTAEGLVL